MELPKFDVEDLQNVLAVSPFDHGHELFAVAEADLLRVFEMDAGLVGEVVNGGFDLK